MDSLQTSDIRLPSVRSFAALFTIVFLIAAVYGAFRGWSSYINIGLLGVAASVGAAGLFSPKSLEPLNRAWFQFGILLGKIISPLVLGAMFFAIITPVAMVTRAFGRDALRLRKRERDTHWIARDPPGPSPESFKNQF